MPMYDSLDNLTCVVPSQKKKENWDTQSIFNFGFFILPKFRFVDVVYVSLEQFLRLGWCEWGISSLKYEVNSYTTVMTAETIKL